MKAVEFERVQRLSPFGLKPVDTNGKHVRAFVRFGSSLQWESGCPEQKGLVPCTGAEDLGARLAALKGAAVPSSGRGFRLSFGSGKRWKSGFGGHSASRRVHLTAGHKNTKARMAIYAKLSGPHDSPNSVLDGNVEPVNERTPKWA